MSALGSMLTYSSDHSSQGYETKASAEKGIEAIKTHVPNAKVEDHSETKSS